MSRVLVTHNYHLALDPREAALARPYPPLGTLVAAANARQQGHDVSVYDPTLDGGPRAFARALEGHDTVAIVADDHSVPQKQCLSSMRRAAFGMIAQAREHGARVLCSGPDASDSPDAYLQAGAQSTVSGEVCEALVEWLNGEDAIQGVHGEQGAGGRRSVIEELGRLPSPAWDLCDLEPYARTWRQHHGTWELNIWTARGCPYRCNWCSKPTWGRTYNVRSPQAVAADIAHVREHYGPDRIWFTDDIFAIRPGWLREFRSALDAPIPYRCLNRVDLVRDGSYTDDLAATGCDEVWVGAESGSDRILAAMDKETTVEEIRAATQVLRSREIRVGFFLQLGYPGESLRDVMSTVRLVQELGPDQIGVSVSYPLPGTPFHDYVSASMKTTNWQASMDNAPLYEAPYSADFYGAAKEVLRSTCSARHAPQALARLVTQPSRRNARSLAGSLYHATRLPWVHGQMVRFARQNPYAVPLTWSETTGR
ncbi:MAG: radical SAM protein [Myxococcota bacterium]|jgi:anaerobic magnesium-protoporphyrin IX monomethyl ester cyclase|nr:radical SAM protein [Myxococcota bacterium]